MDKKKLEDDHKGFISIFEKYSKIDSGLNIYKVIFLFAHAQLCYQNRDIALPMKRCFKDIILFKEKISLKDDLYNLILHKENFDIDISYQKLSKYEVKDLYSFLLKEWGINQTFQVLTHFFYDIGTFFKFEVSDFDEKLLEKRFDPLLTELFLDIVHDPLKNRVDALVKVSQLKLSKFPEIFAYPLFPEDEKSLIDEGPFPMIEFDLSEINNFEYLNYGENPDQFAIYCSEGTIYCYDWDEKEDGKIEINELLNGLKYSVTEVVVKQKACFFDPKHVKRFKFVGGTFGGGGPKKNRNLAEYVTIELKRKLVLV